MQTGKNHRDSGQPGARLTSVLDTVQTEGLRWVLRRLRYRTPLTPAGRSMHTCLRRMLGWILVAPRAIRRQIDHPTVDRDTLYAFFDLQVAPISYDASIFAAAADLTRRRMGLSRIHFVIVPGIKNGLKEERKAYEAILDISARFWRLHNIVLPVFMLVPSFSGLSILPSRNLADQMRAAASDLIYPLHYEPGLPVAHWHSEILTEDQTHGEIGVLRSSPQGLRYVDRWLASRLAGRRLVTITIRDYDFMPARNSNVDAWASFAQRLDTTKYLPIFVLDTERTLDPIPASLSGFEIFREAAWNVGLRMALYETSYVNLGVNNGPSFMCALNSKTRILIFKIVTPGVPQTTEELISKLGYKIGGQLPYATRYQRMIWEDDTLNIIEREFFNFVKLMGHIEAT